MMTFSAWFYRSAPVHQWVPESGQSEIQWAEGFGWYAESPTEAAADHTNDQFYLQWLNKQVDSWCEVG